ncbi:hypothetical protein, partial [Escherichia coli]|uniref:hypothetical protein n=1 Tax=Escherichia coli TaxID=562 RepID=UPI001A7E1235
LKNDQKSPNYQQHAAHRLTRYHTKQDLVNFQPLHACGKNGFNFLYVNNFSFAVKSKRKAYSALPQLSTDKGHKIRFCHKASGLFICSLLCLFFQCFSE